MKQFGNALIAGLVVAIVILAYLNLRDNNGEIRLRLPVDAVVVQPTPTAVAVYVVNPTQEPTATAGYQLTPNPTFTLSYETQVPDLTATSFFGWQTAQAEQTEPTSMTGRIGEGTPTPAIGSRDMSGDQHQRTP